MQSLESLRGYAVRMAALNECPGMVRPYLSSLASISEALPLLAGLTAVNQAVLAPRLSQQALGKGRKKVAQLGSAHIGTQAVRWNERCVCPACIEDGVLSNVLWEIDACIVCPKHRLYLFYQCNKCNSKLSWETSPFDRCSCGQPLSAIQRSQAPGYEVTLSRQLQDSALYSLGKSPMAFRGMKNFEPRVPLDAMLLFIEFGYATLIGAIRASWTKSPIERALIRKAHLAISESICNEELRSAMCRGFPEAIAPLAIGRHAFTKRELVELRWMFGGLEPPESFPLRDQMANRRQRWQGIAPSLVVLDILDESQP